ncbi:MAG: hypothetical protein IPM24_25400 [Bryobacterales bacterium]|nr:hypothetical protein [Bryobacterales bacterium]
MTPHILNGTRESLDRFTRGVVDRMEPPPLWLGLDGLPESPRFVLVANHYQRKGLWILHTASVLTQGIRQRYGAGEPPVRWIVTANWPPLRLGPLRAPNPGDLLLPRVAHALSCYPVAFAGANPARTARTVRRLLSDARAMERPVGLFPEGVAGVAGTVGRPLPGVDRLLRLLAERGLPVVPAGVSEAGRFVLRFGAAVAPEELLAAPDAAVLALDRVRALIDGSPTIP